METAARIGVQATESVKRRGLQFSSELKDFVYGLSLRTSLDTSFPLEYKLLGILLLVFLFLIFLIVVLWDRYGKEISELYAPNTSMTVKGDINDVNVVDEYTIYQKLPTFFYEYVPSKKKRQ